MQRQWIRLALTGISCAGRDVQSGTNLPSHRCPASDARQVALDDANALGFSANDLVEAVSDTFPSEARDEEGSSAGSHDLAVSFAPSTAQVETGLACVTEPAVAVDGTLTIEAADGWFAGSGPALLLGTGTDPGDFYLDGAFSVVPSSELQDAADASVRPCSGSVVGVHYGTSVGFPPTPWGTVLGSLYTESCIAGSGMLVEKTLYELVPTTL